MKSELVKFLIGSYSGRWLASLMGAGVILIGSLGTAAWAQDLHELRVKGVSVDRQSNSPVVIVEAIKSAKSFPIWIGFTEAQAIALEMEHVPTERPMTHDLLKNILAGLKAKVTRVTITDLRDGVFYASILLRPQGGGPEIAVDSRPSDAIALALRVRSPLFVTQKVLEEARIYGSSESGFSASLREQYGIGVQELTPELARFFGVPRAEGVLVSEIVSKSPADSAGVQVGDIILEVNLKTVLNINELSGLQGDILKAGKLQLTLLRVKDGKQNLTLSLTPKPPK